MYNCKAPLSRFYSPDTRRIINAFIIIIIMVHWTQPYTGDLAILQTDTTSYHRPWVDGANFLKQS